MSIVKNTPHYLKHSKKGFTTVQNKTIESIKDPSTLGIYVYLTSKPDDWEISEKNLMNRFGKCRDFIRSRMAELRDIGLLESVAIKNDKGKIVYWEKILYEEVQVHLIKPEVEKSTLLENQVPGNPGDWKTRRMVKPPTTNKRYKEIKDITKHTHSVECDLFLEGEQKRKALMLRAKTINNEKCKELYDQLPQEVKDDKTFEDIHDECVIHYATQSQPQMVSPQRLMSWIKRDIRYHSQDQNKESLPRKEKAGDVMSRVVNKYLKRGDTYDQHGNTIDPLH